MRPLPYPMNKLRRLRNQSPARPGGRPRPAAFQPLVPPPASFSPQASVPGVFQPPVQVPPVPQPQIPAVVAPQNMTFPWCAKVEDYGTGDLYVNAPADIYAQRYEPARRGSQFEYLPDNPDSANPFSGMVGNEYSGGSIVATNPTKDVTWWNVTVFAQELLRTVGQPAPTREEILTDGVPVSVFKVRIRWTEYPGRHRELLIDIGAGVDVFVGPSVRVQVDVMVPVPESAPPVRPDAFGPDGRRIQAFTYVVASATCVQAPVGRKAACFTQSTYLSSPAGGNPAQQNVAVLIPNDARKVQALSASPLGNTFMGFDMFPPARFSTVASTPLITGLVPFVGSATPNSAVPQNSKSVFSAISAVDAPRTVTYKFELQR